jgi:hypothetical protein
LGFVGAFRNLAVIAAINTLMAGAAGGVSAMTYAWLFGPTKKPEVLRTWPKWLLDERRFHPIQPEGLEWNIPPHAGRDSGLDGLFAG